MIVALFQVQSVKSPGVLQYLQIFISLKTI
jgi:hypothetical protein